MPPPPESPDTHQTLADYLAAAMPSASPRSRRRLIQFGRVTINGAPATTTDQPLNPGDQVVIHPPSPIPPISGDSPDAPSSPTPPPLRPKKVPVPRAGGAPVRDRRPAPPRGARGKRPASPGRAARLPAGVSILYEDDDLLVALKPPGLITASPTPVREPTLLDILKDYARRTSPRAPRPRDDSGRQRPRFGVIHRLDREASGLLVFTRSDRAFFALKEEFRAKRVHRHYIALVEGVVGEPDSTGTIQSFLKELPSGRVVSISPEEYRGAPFAPGRRPRTGRDDDDGPAGAARLAVTHYRVLAVAGDLSLLQVRLETGRKHQIRVHLADRGHPIAGDRRYGAKSDPLRRLALHAAELGFTHPATGKSLRFSSPAPDSFYRAVGLPPPKPAAPPPSPAPPPPPRGAAPETSWDQVAQWYDELLEKGLSDHYENVILPGALRLLAPYEGQKVLDVACGQGILSRRLAAAGAHVTGVEASASLVEAAQRHSAPDHPHIRYLVGDARSLAPLQLDRDFDAAACIMALANIDPIEPVFRGVADHLRPGGAFVAVITHPAFRAPRQTSWGWDHREKRQYRRVDGYLSPGQFRIAMHPGKDPSITTWTFHRPIQAYVAALAAAGLLVEALEEWPAQRTSTSGPRAEEENRARREIPLFLALRAIKHAERRATAINTEGSPERTLGSAVPAPAQLDRHAPQAPR